MHNKPPAVDQTLRQHLQILPKAHLHLHLEGAMRPATLTELCERYGIPRPTDTRGQRFDNFGGFVEVFWAACNGIRQREDLARLIFEVAEDAAEQGVWWLEVAFDTERYSELREGQPDQLFADQFEGWRFALEQAEVAGRATGVGIGFISAVDRIMSLKQAEQRAAVTAKLVKTGQHLVDGSALDTIQGEYPGIVGFGLHGNEEGFPPEPFANAFRTALADNDLLSIPHAGEIAPFPDGGAASVAAVVEHLGAHRVQHGVLAATDPQLMAKLAQQQICCDVCPSSNLQLNVFQSVHDHPLPAMLAAGVPCSLGSDDPLLFGPDLLDEYQLCMEQMELGVSEIATLATNSFRFSGAPSSLIKAGEAAVTAWLAENSNQK